MNSDERKELEFLRAEKRRAKAREYYQVRKDRHPEGYANMLAESLEAKKKQTIGLEGSIKVKGDIKMYVRVLDVKMEYGHYSYLIEPIAGIGKTWIWKIEPK